jgi:two-component system response regulator HydG
MSIVPAAASRAKLSSVASSALPVLIVDDDAEMCAVVEESLQGRGHPTRSTQSPDEALALLGETEYAVMVVDIHMEGRSGLDLCREALLKHPRLAVVVMTGFGTLEHAIGAIRAGAYDFVTKPLSMDALSLTVERALEHCGMTHELDRLRSRVAVEQLPSVIGGDSMKPVAELIERVAASDTSVLITGESGTGKELVARALHSKSGRSGPFLAINCAAMPEGLLESELFGYVRGAFTDARTNRNGLFVEAHQGTLFLDEVGEMPLPMQAKLLRALQERKVRPVGGTQEQAFDARLVTATNRDLEAEVRANRFREDLFYRINVVRADVPALRYRGNDVLQLAHFFLERAANRCGKPIRGIDRTAAERLLSYTWPGNVRELENCMERAVALAVYDRITFDDLPPKLRDNRSDELFGADVQSPGQMQKMDAIEAAYIRKVLQATNSNKTLAAKILGFDRRTLYRKLSVLGPSA